MLALPAVAELPDYEECVLQATQKVAAVQHAIRHYDVMMLEVYDEAGEVSARILLPHDAAEEMAQILVPLQVAEEFTDELEWPPLVLRIMTCEGEVVTLDLREISVQEEDPTNYALSLVEYARLQGIVNDALLLQATQKVAAVQHAIRHYDVMMLEVYDEAGEVSARILLPHDAAEEMAQILVPLQVAEEFTDELEWPPLVLRIMTCEGEVVTLDLHEISVQEENPTNYALPLVEYDRLQGIVDDALQR